MTGQFTISRMLYCTIVMSMLLGTVQVVYPMTVETACKILAIPLGTTSVKEIDTAFKKKALVLHPDKFKGTPQEAHLLFYELTDAVALLTNPPAENGIVPRKPKPHTQQELGPFYNRPSTSWTQEQTLLYLRIFHPIVYQSTIKKASSSPPVPKGSSGEPSSCSVPKKPAKQEDTMPSAQCVSAEVTSGPSSAQGIMVSAVTFMVTMSIYLIYKGINKQHMETHAVG